MRHEHRRCERRLLADMRTDFGATSTRPQGVHHRLRPVWRASERGGGQGRKEIGDAGVRNTLTGQRGLVANQGDQAVDKAFCRPALQDDVSIAQAGLQEDQGGVTDGLQECVEPWTL